jgi:hypothetical protein
LPIVVQTVPGVILINLTDASIPVQRPTPKTFGKNIQDEKRIA